MPLVRSIIARLGLPQSSVQRKISTQPQLSLYLVLALSPDASILTAKGRRRLTSVPLKASVSNRKFRLKRRLCSDERDHSLSQVLSFSPGRLHVRPVPPTIGRGDRSGKLFALQGKRIRFSDFLVSREFNCWHECMQ